MFALGLARRVTFLAIAAAAAVAVVATAPASTSAAALHADAHVAQTSDAHSNSLAAATAPEGYPLPARLADRTYPTFYGGYRTVAAYEQFAHDIGEAYPELVETVDFGDSWLKTQDRGGHDLYALRITADVADQPDIDSSDTRRPTFIISAQMHAREIITSEIAWRYVTELLDGYNMDPRVTALLDSTEVWVILQTNPDGIAMVEQALADPTLPVAPEGHVMPPVDSPAWQRKNANDTETGVPTGYDPATNGVDLNRNFPAFWAPLSDPLSEIYPGTSAASEPETQASIALFTSLFGESPVSATAPAPDDRAGTFVNLHSCTGAVAYPYSYSLEDLAPNFAAMQASVFRQSRASGYYAGSVSTTIAVGGSGGTQTDWVYSQLGIAAYSWEVGDCFPTEFFPLFSSAETLYGEVAPGLRFAASAAVAPYTSSLGGIIDSVTAERTPDGSIHISGTASDDRYGPSGMTTAPAVTPITSVEAAVAVDRAHIDKTVGLTLSGEGSTVDFTGTLSAEDTPPGANAIFVRAMNGSGQWGPWTAPDANGVAAPIYTGDATVEAIVGAENPAALSAACQVSVSFSVASGDLPAGLTLEPDGRLSGAATASGATDAVIRMSTASGRVTDVPITFTVVTEAEAQPKSDAPSFPAVPLAIGAVAIIVLAGAIWFLLRLRKPGA